MDEKKQWLRTRKRRQKLEFPKNQKNQQLSFWTRKDSGNWKSEYLDKNIEKLGNFKKWQKLEKSKTDYFPLLIGF